MPLDTREGIQKISVDPSLKKSFYQTEDEINRDDYFGDTSQILVAWGLPKVSVDKYFSFKSKVIEKSLDNINVSWDHVRDFYMPIDGHDKHIVTPDDLPKKGKTLGMFFIEFSDEDTATEVLRGLNGEDITKKHKWHLMRFADWINVEKYGSEFVPPSLDDFKSSNSARAWLEDPQGRDQFMVRYKEGDDHKCAVYWCDHRRGGAVKSTDFSTMLKKRSVLTKLDAEWSPLGSYIFTRHGPGMRSLVQNRTGEWIEDNKFEHAEVDFWDFSPMEKYLVTYSSENDDDNIIFWNIETGEQIRPFDATQCRKFGNQWPFFKWSFDDKYFAWMQSSRVKKKVIPEDLSIKDADKIVIYSTETFRRVGGSSCECKNVKVMDFCPTKHLLVHVTAGNENKPTNINILTVPEKELKVSYPQVSVHRVNLFWHRTGDYLCAAIIKRKKRKKKKKEQSNQSEPDAFSLCIFLTAHKNFPRQTIDLGKDPVRHVTWEPTDPKICVLQEHQGNLFQITVYEFGYDKNNPIRHRLFNDPLIKIPKFSNVAYVSWSPMGRYMCLHHNNGNRTFFDSQKLKRVRGKDKVRDHDSADSLAWSPCGRFVVSTVCTPITNGDDDGAGATDNAWVMYNFQGDEIATQRYKGTKSQNKCLFTFDWRPRPPSLLTQKHKEKIRRRLRDDYWEEFEETDKQIRAEGISDEIRRMLELESEWKLIKERLVEKAKPIKTRREELRDGRLSEDEADFDFEEVEEEMRIEGVCTQTLLTKEQVEHLSSN